MQVGGIHIAVGQHAPRQRVARVSDAGLACAALAADNHDLFKTSSTFKTSRYTADRG